MSEKSIDDYTAAEREAYQQGCDDTHARYDVMQAQASARLARTIQLVAEWERHTFETTGDAAAAELRAAIGLGDVPILCTCAVCVAKR